MADDPRFRRPNVDLGGGVGGFQRPNVDLSGTGVVGDGGDGGWGSFIPTLLRQVEQTATGLPAAATMLYNHPGRFAERTIGGIAHQVAETAPLWKSIGYYGTFQYGDARSEFDKYLDNLREDPLGQILLFSTLGRGSVARAGATAAARRTAEAGKVVRPGVRETVGPYRAGRTVTRREYARALGLGWTPKASVTGLPRETLSARLGGDLPEEYDALKGTPITTRTLPRNYVRAAQAKAVSRLAQKVIPPNMFLVGEHKVAARALRRAGRVPYLALMSLPAYYQMDQAWRSMSKAEKVASRITNYFPMPEDVDTYVSQLRDLRGPDADQAAQTARILTDERYRTLHAEPTDKMREYNRLGHELDQARQKILIDVGAVTPDTVTGEVPEFIASPFRATRIVRGGQYLTDSRAYRFLRKTDADLRALEGDKGKLLRDAQRFGTSDMREITRQGRDAARVMEQESGFRARLHGAERSYYTETPEGVTETRASSTEPIQGSAKRGELQERLPATTDLEHVQNLVDEAADKTDELYRQREDLANGQLDTNTIFDMFDMPAEQRRFGHGAAAMAEDIHAAILRDEEARLKELVDAQARADNGTMSQREMSEWGVTTPTDIRKPTQAELNEARDHRIEADRIAERVKQRKRFRLSESEVTRLRKKIDDLRETARKLENPRPIVRKQATLVARAGGRYASVSRKIEKEIKKQRANVKAAQEYELPGEGDPMGDLNAQALRAIETKYRHQAQRHERLLTVEHALGRSLEKSARAAEKAVKSKAAKARLHEARITYIAAQRARFAALVEHQRELVALRDEIDASRGQLVGGGDPAMLRAEFEQAGRMVPFYSPDVMHDQNQPRFSLATGSIKAPRKRADIYPSRSLLLRHGLINLGVESLGPAYFAAAKHALNVQMHNQAMQMAIKVPRGAGLPTGGKYEYLRRTPSETIGPIEKGKQAHMDVNRLQYDREDDLTTTKEDAPDIDFTDEDGRQYRLIVPKAFADEFRQENKRASNTIKYIFQRPMDVWRTLLLHLRVPWLINNIVGNSFLYSVRFAGVGGLASLIDYYRQDAKTRGYIPAMQRIAKNRLSPEEYRTVFGKALPGPLQWQNPYALTKAETGQRLPEQERGTFLETSVTGEPAQILPEKLRERMQESPIARNMIKLGQWAVTAFPRADKYVENALRRKATNRILRSSDEVQDAFKQMIYQGESPTFREAVDKAMAGDPNFRDYVSTEVNQALGDFLSLSRVERSAIRQAIPFYAWMREITRISARLAIDHPARVLMLQQMAQAASEIQAQDVPGYLKGMILTEKAGILGKIAEALPGGQETPGLTSALNVHGMSPYGSIADMVRGVRALAPGANQYQRREFLGNLNPIFGAFTESFNRPEGEPTLGLVGDTVEGFARSIPQVQAAFPYPSNLYPDRTRADLIAKILGDYRVRYDPDEAAYQQSVGR